MIPFFPGRGGGLFRSYALRQVGRKKGAAVIGDGRQENKSVPKSEELLPPFRISRKRVPLLFFPFSLFNRKRYLFFLTLYSVELLHWYFFFFWFASAMKFGNRGERAVADCATRGSESP